MNGDDAVGPVVRTIVVPASLDEAFSAFTAGMGTWWPRGRSHTILESPLAAAIVEPKVGGRWYHRGVDGSECDVGRVLAWEAPRRIVLGWQIDGRWQYAPQAVSEVELSFEPVGVRQVRVTLEHRALGVFGASASALRAAIDADGGWPLLLRLYADMCGAKRQPSEGGPDGH